MKNKYIKQGILLLAGALLGHFFLYFLASFGGGLNQPPSQKQTAFVETCSKLDGEELTFQNVSTLSGWCSPQGELIQCGPEHVKRLEDGTDPFFPVRQSKTYDNTWVCSIDNTNEGTMKTWIHYQYE